MNGLRGRSLVRFILAMVSLFIFVQIERSTQNPILSLELFKNRVFLVSVSALFLTSMGMFGAIIYVPIFSQGVIGGSATHAGLVLTPMMLGLVVASTLSGQIISRTGRYKNLAVVGTGIAVAGLFYFSTLNENTTNIALIMRMIVLGLGLGVTMPIFTLAVQSAFPGERLGEVTAGSQLFRSVGGTVGTAILGGIMNSRLAGQMTELRDEPFVSQMGKMAGNTATQPDGSLIQTVLSPQAKAGISQMIAGLPDAQRSVATTNFDHFVESAKQSFSNAVDGVFLVAALLMTATFIIVLFLPEIPLRRSARPAMEETGIMLEDELGQSDDDCQPRMQAARHER